LQQQDSHHDEESRFGSHQWLSDFLLVKDKVDNCKQVSFKIDNLNLNKGIYYVTTYIEVDNSLSDWIQNAFSFEIVEGDFYGTGRQVPVKQSKIIMDFKTEFK
jgi:lipopolysaccharide transport system ATP-binding protein